MTHHAAYRASGSLKRTLSEATCSRVGEPQCCRPKETHRVGMLVTSQSQSPRILFVFGLSAAGLCERQRWLGTLVRVSLVDVSSSPLQQAPPFLAAV